jgi:hypothetical protein
MGHPARDHQLGGLGWPGCRTTARHAWGMRSIGSSTWHTVHTPGRPSSFNRVFAALSPTLPQVMAPAHLVHLDADEFTLVEGLTADVAVEVRPRVLPVWLSLSFWPSLPDHTHGRQGACLSSTQPWEPVASAGPVARWPGCPGIEQLWEGAGREEGVLLASPLFASCCLDFLMWYVTATVIYECVLCGHSGCSHRRPLVRVRCHLRRQRTPSPYITLGAV